MTDIKRRKFVSLMTAGAAVVPVSALIASLPSHASDKPLVDPTSAEAAGLQYVEVSENAELNCANCSLYEGTEGKDMGSCTLFPNNAVMGAGWCIAHQLKG